MNDIPRKNVVLQLSGHGNLPYKVETTGIKQYSKEFFNHNFSQLVDNDIYLQKYLQVESERVVGPRQYDIDNIKEGPDGYKTWSDNMTVGDVAVFRKKEIPLSASVQSIDYFNGKNVTGICRFRGNYLFSYGASLVMMPQLNSKDGIIINDNLGYGQINGLTSFDGYPYAAFEKDGVYQVGLDAVSGKPILIIPRLNYNEISGVTTMTMRNGQYFLGTRNGIIWTGLAGQNFTGVSLPSYPMINDIFVKDVTLDDRRADSKALEKRVLVAASSGLYQSDVELTCTEPAVYKNAGMNSGRMFVCGGYLYLATNNGLYKCHDNGMSFSEIMPTGYSSGSVSCYSVIGSMAYIGGSFKNNGGLEHGIYVLSDQTVVFHQKTESPVRAICAFKTGPHMVLMYVSGGSVYFNIDNEFLKIASDDIYSDDIIDLYSPSTGCVIVVRQQRIDLYNISVSEKIQTLSVQIIEESKYSHKPPHPVICKKTFNVTDRFAITYQRVGDPVSSAIYGYDFQSTSPTLSLLYSFTDDRVINEIQPYKLSGEDLYAVFTQKGTSFFKPVGKTGIEYKDVSGQVQADILSGNIMKYVQYGESDLFFTQNKCMQFKSGKLSEIPDEFSLLSGQLSTAAVLDGFVYTVEDMGSLNAYSQYEHTQYNYYNTLFPLSGSSGTNTIMNRIDGDRIYCSDGIYIVSGDVYFVNYSHVPRITYSVDFIDYDPLLPGSHIVGRRLGASDTGGNFIQYLDISGEQYSWTLCCQDEFINDSSRIARIYDARQFDDIDPQRNGKIYVTDKRIYYNELSVQFDTLFSYGSYDSIIYCHNVLAMHDNVNVITKKASNSTGISAVYSHSGATTTISVLPASISIRADIIDHVSMTNKFIVGDEHGISSVLLSSNSEVSAIRFVDLTQIKQAEYKWFSSVADKFYAVSSVAYDVSPLVFNYVSSLELADTAVRVFDSDSKFAVIDTYVVVVEYDRLYIYDGSSMRLSCEGWIDHEAGGVLSVFGGNLQYQTERDDELSCTHVISKQIRIDVYCDGGLMQCQILSADQLDDSGQFLPKNISFSYLKYPSEFDDPTKIVVLYNKCFEYLSCGATYYDNIDRMHSIAQYSQIAYNNNVYYVDYDDIRKYIVYDDIQIEALAGIHTNSGFPVAFSDGNAYIYSISTKRRPKFDTLVDFAYAGVKDFHLASDRMFILCTNKLYYSEPSSRAQLSTGGLGSFKYVDLLGVNATQSEIDGLDVNVIGTNTDGLQELVYLRWDNNKYSVTDRRVFPADASIYGIACASNYQHAYRQDGTQVNSGILYLANGPGLKYDELSAYIKFGNPVCIRQTGVNGVAVADSGLLAATSDGVKEITRIGDSFNEIATYVTAASNAVYVQAGRSFAVTGDGVYVSKRKDFLSAVFTHEVISEIRYDKSERGICISAGVLQDFEFKRDMDVTHMLSATNRDLVHHTGCRIRSYMLDRGASAGGGRVIVNILIPNDAKTLTYETFDVNTLMLTKYKPYNTSDASRVTDMFFTTDEASQDKCIAVGELSGKKKYYYVKDGIYEPVPTDGPDVYSACHDILSYASDNGYRTYIFHNTSASSAKVYSYFNISYLPVYKKIDSFCCDRCNSILQLPDGKLVFSTERGIVRVNNGVYYLDKLAPSGECLVIKVILSLSQYLYFSAWKSNNVKQPIYRSENGYDWTFAFDVDKPINSIYVADRSTIAVACNGSVSYTPYLYQLVNDYPPFTDASVNAIYSDLSSRLSSEYQAEFERHINQYHNINSTIFYANNNILDVDLERIAGDWTSISGNHNTIENDLLLSSDFGNAFGQTLVSVFVSNWFTDNNLIPVPGVSYIANIYRSGTRHVYVNIPTTYTHYMCHTTGCPCCDKHSMAIPRPEKTDESGRPVLIQSDMSRCKTDICVILDNTVFSGDNIFEANACGNSLPLGIYKDRTNKCGPDGIASNLFHSTVMDTRVTNVSKRGLTGGCIVKMQCFGTDAQSLMLSEFTSSRPPLPQPDPGPISWPDITCFYFESVDDAASIKLVEIGTPRGVRLLSSNTGLDGSWGQYSTGIAYNFAVPGERFYLKRDPLDKRCMFSKDIYNYYKFSMNGKIASHGSVQLLLSSDHSAACPAYCYYGLFSECSSLTNAPDLPATELGDGCYASMFMGCSSLSVAPELPARKLAVSCYKNMFRRCSAMVSPPHLYADTLAEYCYSAMFADCVSLATAPSLTASVLEDYCYQGMFQCCSSLVSAPSLDAMTLADGCYYSMFYGCKSLVKPPELPAVTMSDRCYGYMFNGCSSLSSAPALPAEALAGRCYSYMFYLCDGFKYCHMRKSVEKTYDKSKHGDTLKTVVFDIGGTVM